MRSRRARLAGAAAACFLLGAARPEAAAEPRVALAVATRVNVTRDEGEKIVRSFARALERGASVRVVRTVGEVSPNCLERARCLRRLADRASAKQILLLLIVRLGNQLKVGITWAHPNRNASAVRNPVFLESGQLAADYLTAKATSWLPKAGIDAARSPASRRTVAQLKGMPNPSERAEPLGVWIAGSVSLASLAGGLVFAYQADREYASLKEENCKRRTCDRSRLLHLDRDALLADIFLGTALAAGAAAAVIHFTSDRDDKASDRGDKASKLPVSAKLKHGGALVTWEQKF